MLAPVAVEDGAADDAAFELLAPGGAVEVAPPDPDPEVAAAGAEPLAAEPDGASRLSCTQRFSVSLGDGDDDEDAISLSAGAMCFAPRSCKLAGC